ncbi:putative protein kinase [Leishmania braziliensis MHOM/BR/75/M2904]|uniref:Protein kinase domain-containing protein n=2 Tax=Leishmania braziliensis TaxID=5660 RepID=A4HFR4_LEIBR|nr:putative protein kinase [Leishmania braziliensis MHOM/BR/75/M2904]CAJ2475296.1 unnamed protein product [Leishmania braziliensis]CAM45428.2 putative protein kinase [Leishmania braziliensis MHOM/BR/75/M2904]SYZ67065.1 protein_kinase [Leishmania braziliensis MHOM/BR/75/M2904]
MNSSPASTHTSAFPDADTTSIALSSEEFLECPRCHRHCKSRTWFLKHLEACSKSASSSSTRGNTVSGEGSTGTPRAVAFPTKSNHHYRHLSRSSATEDDTPLLLESMASTTTSSSTSHSHQQSHKPSRLTHVAGSDGREAGLSNSIDAGPSANAGLSRSSVVALGGYRDGRSESNHTPTATSQASPHWFIDDLLVTRSTTGVGAGGGIISSGMSRPTSPSQGSPIYVASPCGLRAGGSCSESGSAHVSAAFGSASAPAAAQASSSSYMRHRDEGQTHRQPARQESFRLQSDFTWTQYTPSASEEEKDDDALGEHDGSVLDYSIRQLSRNTGAEQLTGPGYADRAPDQWVHERLLSGGSNTYRTNSPGAVVDVSRHAATDMLHDATRPLQGEQQVPRIFSGSIAELSPLARNVSGVADGCQSVGSGTNSARFHRSAHGSASPVSHSRTSSCTSPVFSQAIGSPSFLRINVSPTSATPIGSSANQLNGLNASFSGGSGRTPRQGDRCSTVTPRTISFQRGRAVGSGGFGTVYQAILSDGSLAAVKELKLENANLKAIDREVRAMSSIPPHPNCVRYLGSRYSAHHYYIIMEYISGGSINSLRKSVGRFRESVFQRYAYMVLLGLSHLHANGIVHRDIKGANVLLDESGCAKIVDFGCSGNLNQATTTLGCGGTPLWMAPEVCRGDPATEKSDIWAYGCLCLEMTNDTGVPWNFLPGMTLQGVVYALACAKSPPPIPTDLSSEAQDFLRCCLRVDPEERATVAELLQHPFFDVDLMENSEEDELLSSCEVSARQSAVKRVVQQVNRSSALDAAAHVHEQQQYRNKDGEVGGSAGDAQGSPLLQGFAGVSLSSRGIYSGGCGPILEPDAGALSRSSNSHSKSPSGPQLDHYTRSVNIGFSLQPVDDDDDDTGDGAGELEDNAGPSPSLCGGPPSAIAETAVSANRCRTSFSYAGVEEDENEYKQMITEIITQAREAYTDEERRMTERQRKLNLMCRSSDEDTSITASASSGSDTNNSGGGNGSDSRSSAEENEMSQHGDIESDLSTLSSSDEDDGLNSHSVGGPRRHSLGATWRAQFTHPSAASEKAGEPQGAASTTLQQEPVSVARGEDSMAPLVSASSSCRGRLPRPGTNSSATLAATSPTSARVDSTDTSISPYGAISSSTPGLEVSPQSQLSPHSAPPHPSLTSPYPPRKQQPRPSPLSPPMHLGEVMKRDFSRTASRSRISTPFSKSPSDSVVVTAAGGVASSPHETGGPAGLPTAVRQPVGTSPSSPHIFVGAENPLPLPSAPAAQHGTVGGPVLSDRSSSTRNLPLQPPLTVGGPHRQTTPPQPAPTTAPPSAHPDFAASSTEWCFGSSGRIDANSATWKTGASDHLSRELSMAQKEMQEMLDWGTSSDRRHTLSSSSPDIGRRSSKASSTTAPSAVRGDNGHRSRCCFRHLRRSHGENADPESTPVTANPSRHASTGLSAMETVPAVQQPAKRKLCGLGIFRSMRSK